MLELQKTSAMQEGCVEDSTSGISAALRYLTAEAERQGLQELAGLIGQAAIRASIESRRVG